MPTYVAPIGSSGAHSSTYSLAKASMASSIPTTPTLRERTDRVRAGFNVSATSETRKTIVVGGGQYRSRERPGPYRAASPARLSGLLVARLRGAGDRVGVQLSVHQGRRGRDAPALPHAVP